MTRQSRPQLGTHTQNQAVRGGFLSDIPKAGASLQRACARWALLSALTLVLTALACSGGQGPLGIDSRTPLRVGVSPTYPPVIFESDGQILGIEADLARVVGNALDRRIVFERYSRQDLFPALMRGDVDVVMSGLSASSDGTDQVRFTVPYMKAGQLAIIRSSEIVRLGRRGSIYRNGVRVGYERGRAGEKFVANDLAQANSFAFDDVDAGIRSLRAGRIDFFVHDAPTVWRLAGDPTSRDLQGLYRPLTEEHLAWAVRSGNTSLLARLDTTISHWKREGLIEPIIDRWIPVRVTLR